MKGECLCGEVKFRLKESYQTFINATALCVGKRLVLQRMPLRL